MSFEKIEVVEFVNDSVLQRKQWAKFGAEKGSAPGPHQSSTVLGDDIVFELGLDWREITAKAQKLKVSQLPSIRCRLCEGPHYTYKCPDNPSKIAAKGKKT